MLIPGKDPTSIAANVGSLLLGLAAYGLSILGGAAVGITIALWIIALFISGEVAVHLLFGNP